jgi:hypothetical protein
MSPSVPGCSAFRAWSCSASRKETAAAQAATLSAAHSPGASSSRARPGTHAGYLSSSRSCWLRMRWGELSMSMHEAHVLSPQSHEPSMCMQPAVAVCSRGPGLVTCSLQAPSRLHPAKPRCMYALSAYLTCSQPGAIREPVGLSPGRQAKLVVSNVRLPNQGVVFLIP